MHPDHLPYAKFTSKARVEKALNSLLGFVEGISIDGVISDTELEFLELWLTDHAEVRNRHPFNELIPLIEAAIGDGILDNEEREDIRWLCERMRSSEYSDTTTADLQRLHAILGGIVADGEITEEELRGLRLWLDAHEHLRTCWPYDEVDSLITQVLQDKRIDPEEQKQLREFFSEFTSILDDQTITRPLIQEGTTVVGLCAVCPEITFAGAIFCFTGASSRYKRTHLADTVNRLGGVFVSSLSGKVHYLVIGSEGNPSWAYACYGRKVERAVELRKAGARLMIIHENDFHDAVLDAE